MPSTTLLITTMACTLALTGSGPDEPRIEARNLVRISEKLVTCGQPTAASLAALSQQGFQAVVNLAPATARDAVAEEPEIVRKQGMEYVNIPIDWKQPTEADLAAFTETMKKLQGRKVLVHCQANMRASAMTFLYRVIECGEKPEAAYQDVLKVWTPQEQWKEFVNDQLKKAKIAFRVE